MPTGYPAEFSDLEQRAIREAYRQDWSIRAIAAYVNRPPSVVYRFLRRPIETTEHVELVFPVNGFAPASEPTEIRPGDAAICMVSNQSGLDFLPGLQADAHDRPQPETTIYRPDTYKGGKG
jgi:hypothetical protein